MTGTPVWAAVVAVIGVVVAGSYAVAVSDRLIGTLVAGARVRWRDVLAGPMRSAALSVVQGRTVTERPDAAAWALAPALYLGLGATALAVIPLSRTAVVADIDTGLVMFGAAQALATIPIFLNGWSSNSLLPEIGAFRFIAQALSYEMPNLLALLSVTVPAASLRMADIVASQQDLWNVVRLPLGLPLFLFAAAGLSFWGPLNLPDGADLAGGTAAETSGVHLLIWKAARATMLVANAAMGAAAFAGGWLGPVLPGWSWMLLKTSVLLVLLVATRHLAARVRIERFVIICWAVLIPLALLNVVIAAAVSL